MYYSDAYLNDLVTSEKSVPHIEKLSGKRIFITGAGGLICSSIVDFLIALNDERHYGIQVYVAGRDADRINSRFGAYAGHDSFHFAKYDASAEIEGSTPYDYIIHGASNANPGAYQSRPVETMLTNIIGVSNILKYADEHKCGRVLYISSSEVYGQKTSREPYRENDYGYLDILNPRACYPSSKRAAETLCASYAKEHGVDFVVVRPGHVYGPTCTKNDNRASSQFPKDVISGKDIIMKTPGTQMRSYCYALDCATAILTVLINGKSGEAYNISNRSSLATIRDIAEAFAEAGNRKVLFEGATEEEKASYNLMDNSSLNAEKLEALGWQGVFDLKTGTARTLVQMKYDQEQQKNR